MGAWIFYTAVVLVVGAVWLYAWRRNDPPAALTPRRRERLTAIRGGGRTAFILWTGVLGFGLTLAVVKTIVVYAGFYEWRQPELEPLPRFGYWFIRMVPLSLLLGAIWAFIVWRVESKRFHLLDAPPATDRTADG